jgi:hypothetical protein
MSGRVNTGYNTLSKDDPLLSGFGLGIESTVVSSLLLNLFSFAVRRKGRKKQRTYKRGRNESPFP